MHPVFNRDRNPMICLLFSLTFLNQQDPLYGQCSAAIVGQKRDGDKYLKAWDTNHGSLDFPLSQYPTPYFKLRQSNACLFTSASMAKLGDRIYPSASRSTVSYSIGNQKRFLSSQVPRTRNVRNHFDVLLDPTFPAWCIDKPYRLLKMPVHLAARRQRIMS